MAGYVGPERSTERALRALAEELLEQEPNPVAKYTVRLAAAVTLHYRGRFKEAKEALDPIQALATNRRVGAQTALLFTIHSIQFLGDMTDLTDRYTRALADAEERGNLFMSVALRTSTAASVWLAADDPAKARRELREAMAQWAQKRFSSPEWRATLSEAEVDLYVGDAPGAYERVRGLLRAMRKNFFFVYHSRALVAFIHGRAAIASAAELVPRSPPRAAEGSSAPHWSGRTKEDALDSASRIDPRGGRGACRGGSRACRSGASRGDHGRRGGRHGSTRGRGAPRARPVDWR